MNRTFRNTTAVLVLTVFTVLAVFAAVQLIGRVVGTPNASAQTTGAQSPGASSPAGTGQQDPNGYGQGSDAYGYGQSAGNSGTQGSSDGTLTCPSTGCTASTCHASQ